MNKPPAVPDFEFKGPDFSKKEQLHEDMAYYKGLVLEMRENPSMKLPDKAGQMGMMLEGHGTTRMLAWPRRCTTTNCWVIHIKHV